MSDDNPILSYTELINEIKMYSDNMISGTLLIATTTNLLIRLIMDEGKISGLICGARKGMDVMPDLQNITEGRIKYSASKMAASSNVELPATQEIIRQLFNSPGGSVSANETPVYAAGTQIDTILNIIENELIEFLGPMASFVWEEHINKIKQPFQPKDLKRLMDLLGKEIGDVKKINLFEQRIKEKIANI